VREDGRLSEDPARTVLLLEAGPDERSAATPAAVRGLNFFGALESPGRLWPDLLATRAPGRPPSLYARGRGVGGSSAVNALMAIRGTPEDYDRWAGQLGCPGGLADMLTRFLKLEDDVDLGGDRLHGRSGPIPSPARPSATSGRSTGPCAALTALGYPSATTPRRRLGLSRVASPSARASRVDQRRLPRTGANVRTSWSAATSSSTGWPSTVAASGSYTADGELLGAGEVIVSAGAILPRHPPAVGHRSGGSVGGLPVGANLVDHAATPASS
jgi:choline dehydrogenase-like flavoprotein